MGHSRLSVALAVIFVMVFAACSDDASGPVSIREPVSTLAPAETIPSATMTSSASVTAETVGDTILKDRYVIRFDKEKVDNAAQAVATLQRAMPITPHHIYEHVFKGFSATIPPQALPALKKNPLISNIEPDYVGTVPGHAGSMLDQQTNPSWGLDRIDQYTLPLNSTYNYFQTGSGVDVYALDTGIRITHTEFGGRASHDYNTSTGHTDADDCYQLSNYPVLGHGTPAAAIIGGSTYGVAKSARIHAVKIYPGCGGTTSSSEIIAGVNWVAGNHNSANPAIMLINTQIDQGGIMLTLAVSSAADDYGILSVLPAGNYNADACTLRPQNHHKVLVVGNTTPNDQRNIDSNYGTCVDLFAPGTSIPSACADSNSCSYGLWTGTSFAAPHAVGVGALRLAANPNLSADLLHSNVVTMATDGVLNPAGLGSGSPNKLLHSVYMDVQTNHHNPITEEGNYTWEAFPYGADGNYSYIWEYAPDGSSNYTQVGTGKTYTRFVSSSDNPGFSLKVTATSGLGYTDDTVEPVYSNIDETCIAC